MSLPAQKFRELLFQLLYSHDIGEAQEAHITPLLMRELSVTKRNVALAYQRMREIAKRLPEIDSLIAATSLEYRFERIPCVERNVLRVGVYELLYDPEIPAKVAIAEAMRLAKKFSTRESSQFINALLDAIYKQKSGAAVHTEELHSSTQILLEAEATTSNIEVVPESESNETAEEL